jgi:4-hydroxy-tetrahydrodipicolinate synthase
MNSKLKKSSDFYGVWTALVTPFDSTRAIDRKSFKALIEDQLKAGIHGFVVGGSTGEASLMPEKQYEELLSLAREYAPNTPLLAGLGIGGTESCLKNSALAVKLGYDGLLASPPAYVKAPQRALVKHFLKLAQSEAALCLYEIPGRSASSIATDTLEEILKHPDSRRILAIKDATANIPRAMEEAQRFGSRMALLTGDDETFHSFLAAGGNGVISVATHVVPKEFVQIFELMKTGDTRAALKLQITLNPLIAALFWESNPIPVKSLLHKLRRLPVLEFKEPLCSMNDELLEKLLKLYEKVRSH